MTRHWRRWVVGGCLLLTGGWFTAQLVSSRLLGAQLERSLHQRTGLTTRVGSVRVQWTRGRVVIQRLELENPPAFGGGILLRVPRTDMDLDGAALLQGRLLFQQLSLHVAEVRLVRDRMGELNIRPLLQSLPRHRAPGTVPPPKPAPRASDNRPFGGIDRLVLTLGRLSYTDLAHPDKSDILDLGIEDEVVRNLRTVDDVKRWLTGLLLRVAVQDYLVNPARSRSRIFDMLLRGLKRVEG